MMRQRWGATAAVAGLIALAGCAEQPGSPGTHPVAPRFKFPTAGLERVLGKDARELIALFGTPDQDLKEASARRLVFVGPACVLDAYLYPPSPDKEPVVTWIDARLPNGDDIDRASCVAALTRR